MLFLLISVRTSGEAIRRVLLLVHCYFVRVSGEAIAITLRYMYVYIIYIYICIHICSFMCWEGSLADSERKTKGTAWERRRQGKRDRKIDKQEKKTKKQVLPAPNLLSLLHGLMDIHNRPHAKPRFSIQTPIGYLKPCLNYLRHIKTWKSNAKRQLAATCTPVEVG